MPYFYKPDEVNLLFIHIPKTGGTSIEQYLSNKYNIPLDEKSLYHSMPDISLQHYTYENIIYHPQIRLVDGYETFTIVRNPYHRLASDLFFLGLANRDMSPADIYDIIENQYQHAAYDNHATPQYEFIYDMSNNTLYDHIYVLKSEGLNEEVAALGYTDFDVYANKGPIENHMDYLNDDSIEYINRTYARDFEFFDYKMLSPELIDKIVI
jgi:hypothetical protein